MKSRYQFVAIVELYRSNYRYEISFKEAAKVGAMLSTFAAKTVITSVRAFFSNAASKSFKRTLINIMVLQQRPFLRPGMVH